MNKIRNFVYAVLCSALCTAALEAQTPAAITVVSGNGQLICELCITGNLKPFAVFDPLVVEVIDANGNPVQSTQVVWNVTGGTAYIGLQGGIGQSSATTTTGSNGQTSINIGQAVVQQGVAFGAQSTITATAAGHTVTFYESQAAPTQATGTIDVQVNYAGWPISSSPSLSGIAGSTGGSYTMSVSSLSGAPIAGVGVMLLNVDAANSALDTIGPSSSTIPSVYCETQAGSGNYTVLTDSTGTATCNVAFGPVVGSKGNYQVVIGGSVSQTAGNPPDTNFESGPLSLDVTQATVGAVTVVSGNNQTGLAGTALNALVAEVVDPNAKPLAEQVVTWAATPASAIQLNSVTSTSTANGQVEVANPVLSTSAVGSIIVTATSATNASAVATFNIIATQPVTVTSVSIETGNNQSAVEGATFPTPLAVAVLGSNGGPVSGSVVSFTASGPVTLSASSTTTTSTGVALVNATAGNTPGTATVTASIGGQSATFTLTVLPPGPNLTASSFINGADGQVGSISPCSVAGITSSGVAPGGAAVRPVVGPVPLSLATDTVNFGTVQAPLYAPIFSVSSANPPEIVIQVPCEVTPGTVPVIVDVGNGGTQTISVTVKPASPGVFQWTNPDGVVRAAIERPDGTFASNTNPTAPGEIDTVFVTGLGQASPQVATGQLPIPGTPSTVDISQIVVGINNNGVLVTSAQLSPDLIGVYAVQFQVPTNAPAGDNIVFSVGFLPAGSSTKYYSAASAIPIQ